MSFYLYTDASIKAKGSNKAHHAYTGGMITDDNGKIVYCFYDKIFFENGVKTSNIDYAEAAAIEIGITHAESMGIKNIKCFTDSRHCVQGIQNFQFNFVKNKKLLSANASAYTQKICDILAVTDEFFDSFEIQHIPRERNQYADHMSKYLRIFHEGNKLEIQKFKEMLKVCLLSECVYDFVEERKAYIRESDDFRGKQNADRKALKLKS